MNDADSVIRSLSAANRKLREENALLRDQVATARERLAEAWDEGFESGSVYGRSFEYFMQTLDQYGEEPWPDENPYQD